MSTSGLGIGSGLSQDYYRKMREQFADKSQKNIPEETLHRLAKTLNTSVEHLVFGGKPRKRLGRKELEWRLLKSTLIATPVAHDIRGLAVAGKVSAGNWMEIGANAALHDTPVTIEIPADPRYRANEQYAVVVEGTSINRVAQPGDFLVVADIGQPRDGDLVIAIRTRCQAGLREVTAKRFCMLGDVIELRHDSVDPRYTDTNHPDYQAPIRFQLNHQPDDDTEIEIRGIVLGVWHPTV